jgi:formiminotetrahydrofolate cyclodeaminase
MPVAEDFLDRRVRDLLEDIAAQRPRPAVSVAAIAVAMAQVSSRWRHGSPASTGGRGAAAQAEALRAHVAQLARADANAYEKALEALRLPKDGDSASRPGARRGARAASSARIAAAGADVAMLAADVAGAGSPISAETPLPGRARRAGNARRGEARRRHLGTMRGRRIVAAKASSKRLAK